MFHHLAMIAHSNRIIPREMHLYRDAYPGAVGYHVHKSTPEVKKLLRMSGYVQTKSYTNLHTKHPYAHYEIYHNISPFNR